MQKTFVNNPNHFDDDIDLKEIFKALWQHKWIIVSITSLISFVALIYSLYLPNIYQSKALLTPITSSSSISKSLQRYSGLAGLAGISLPSVSDQDSSDKALAKLKSLSFFEQNFLPNIFLPDLMALSSWDYATNKLNYDQVDYDEVTNTWIRDLPSTQESYKTFINHFQLSEDQQTGFITIKINHQSPFVAKKWLEIIVNQINLFFREKDKLEANKALNYLREQFITTNLIEIKQVISELVKEETQKLALIEANQNYVFDYIDPPVVMEEKSEPKRALICILATIMGFIVGIIYVMIKYFYSRDSAS